MTRRLFWATFLVFGGLGLWLYHPVLHFGFLSYDDSHFIHSNLPIYLGPFPDLIKWAFTNIIEIYWVPGAWLIYALNAKLFGVWAGGYHFVSVFGHLLNAFVLVSITVKIFRNNYVAFLVGLFFLIHPIHVETVYWVTVVRDVYAAFFVLLCVRMRLVKDGNCRPVLISIFEMFCFFLACILKPNVIVLPFLFLVLDFAVGRIGKPIFIRLAKRDFIGYSIIIAFILYMNSWTHSQYIKDYLETMGLFSLHRYFSLLRAPLLLVGKFVYPVDLSIIYVRGSSYSLVISLIGLTLLFWTTVLSWKYRSRNPIGFMSWIWFMGFLIAPVCLVTSIVMADRYMYLPSIGLLWGAALFCIFLINKKYVRPSILVTLVLLPLFLALLVSHMQYAKVWRSSKSLFLHATKVMPNSSIAWNELGIAYHAEGQYEEAVKCFSRSIKIPHSKDVRSDKVRNIKNLAASLSALGKTEAALETLKLIYTEESKKPYELNELAIVYDLQGDDVKAEQLFKRALEYAPLNQRALLRLSAIYARRCDVDNALIHVEKLIAINDRYLEGAHRLRDLIYKIRDKNLQDSSDLCADGKQIDIESIAI